MPEYISTKDLGNIKAGTKLVKINNAYMLHSDDYQKFFTEEEILLLIQQGWVEEVQELKYTKKDMIDFLEYINHNYLMEDYLPYHTILEDYEKSR